jgi:GxxExxY protein
MSKLLYKELSDQVLGAAFTVHSALGPGLLESLYQKAMCIELKYRHIYYECQSPYDVFYRDEFIGRFYADLVIEKKIIVELKAVKILKALMEAQTINYLKISNIAIGYLINFNSISLVWKRFYHRKL